MKSLSFFFLFLLSLAFQQNWASDFRWDLQITNPQFDVKYTRLNKEAYKPYLKKTSWRCQVGPVHLKNLPKGALQWRSLLCNYSVKKTGQVTTFVGCSSPRPYGEGVLELFDERKNLTFKIMLSCRSPE